MTKQNHHCSLPVAAIIERQECLPVYSSKGAAGADLRAHLNEAVVLLPGCALLVPTGLRLAIPEGFEAQVRPRSGLAIKHGITVLNTPGTIDEDYRGEIGVILINHGKTPFTIEPLMRIAQLVIAPYTRASFFPSEELVVTERGTGGFGHTGV